MPNIKAIIDDGKEIIEDGKEILENSKEIIETRKELIEDLFERTEEYVKTNIQLAKYKAIDKLAELVSSIAATLALVIFGFFFFIMLNIGIAIWLGQVTGSAHLGYFIVAGFYAVLTLLVFILGKNLIKTPVSDAIISQMIK